MSVASVRAEIGKFLGRPAVEVLCIRGKWGVGKTYTWSNQVAEAHKAGAISLARYSYVSLFGVNSLDELKIAIFENVITLSEGLQKADITTLDSFVSKQVNWRKWTKVVQAAPIVKRFVGSDLGAILSFMSIRDQIICIDDLGSGLITSS